MDINRGLTVIAIVAVICEALIRRRTVTELKDQIDADNTRTGKALGNLANDIKELQRKLSETPEGGLTQAEALELASQAKSQAERAEAFAALYVNEQETEADNPDTPADQPDPDAPVI